MSKIHLKINNIDCYYDATKVLDKVIFTVKKGEFVGIMGPNGSGKTTLLRCINNILKPKKGVVLIDEYDVSTLSRKEIAKKIAVVPQDKSISAEYTVFEIVLMGRAMYTDWLRTESLYDLNIVKDAMHATNTWHLRDRLITMLSGGEKQRVIIARALAQQPDVLLLDEPTVHLDISYQIEILELVKKLSRLKCITVVAVFHDINLASQYCEKLILLSNGRIIAQGSAEDVLQPVNIKSAYNIDAIVKKNPVTNTVFVMPYISKKIRKNLKFGVHIISGGGTGSYLMKALLEKGFQISAGVLSTLDTDYETARTFDVCVVPEIPFTMISENAYRLNIDFIKKSDAVIVTEFPVGEANLDNLRAAEEALSVGKKVIVISSISADKKDFAFGKAQDCFARLKQNGACFVRTVEDALEVINKLYSHRSHKNHKN